MTIVKSYTCLFHAGQSILRKCQEIKKWTAVSDSCMSLYFCCCWFQIFCLCFLFVYREGEGYHLTERNKLLYMYECWVSTINQKISLAMGRVLARILKLPVIFERVSIQNDLGLYEWSKLVIFCLSKMEVNLPKWWAWKVQTKALAMGYSR